MQYIKYFVIILLILILVVLLSKNTNQQIKENYLDYNLNDNDFYKKNILEAPKRLIAIGDIHADYKSLRNIFIGLKLIDSNNNWVAPIAEPDPNPDSEGNFYVWDETTYQGDNSKGWIKIG